MNDAPKGTVRLRLLQPVEIRSGSSPGQFVEHLEGPIDVSGPNKPSGPCGATETNGES